MRRFIHLPGHAARVCTFSIFAFLLLGLSACGGGAGSTAQRAANGFELRVSPDSFIHGGSGSFELQVDDAADNVRVDLVAAQAQGLRAVYFELDYDASRFTPIGVQSSGELNSQESGEPRLIELGILGRRGTVHHGQLIARAQERRGFTGSGVLATITFARRPLPRAASAAPKTDLSKTTLSWDGSGVLKWSFSSVGDYSQNGQVNISDLTPLGANFDESVAPAVFPYESALSVVDGDSNGQINISDITPIGANFDVGVVKYEVFGSSSSSDYPLTNDSASGVPAVGEVLVGASADSPATTRLTYTFAIPSPGDGHFYWVRPADAGGPGTPSNALQFMAPNQGPVADLTADVTEGPLPLTVTFDASGSTDPDGTITKFRIDYDGGGAIHDWVDMDLATEYIHTYDFEGEGTYNAVLEVTDNDGAKSIAQLPITVTPQETPMAIFSADPTSGSLPLEVTFDGSFSTDNEGIVNYEWDFDGDGAFEVDSGNNPEVVHTYDNEGVYSPQLRVTDTDNLQHSAPGATIDVGPAAGTPVAVIFATPTTVEQGNTVSFDGSGSWDSDGVIMRYEWDFDGDGTYDFESTPFADASHAYPAQGTYQATLRVTDNEDKTDTDSVMIQVNGTSQPGAVLYANPRYGPVGQKVDFDASESTSDSPITKYEFDWEGDGVFDYDGGTDPFVTHAFDAEGIYDTTVRTTDADLNQYEKIMLVFISDSLPLDDSIFAIPSQSWVNAGEAIGVEVYTHNAANPFQYATGIGLTMQNSSSYKKLTFNIGQFGGEIDYADGVWAAMSPFGFLIAPDNFLQFSDIGGGRHRFDVNVTPLGGSDLTSATGALCNMEFVFNEDTTLSFERTNIVPRTYYQDSNQTPDYFWSSDDNAGLPTIDVL